MFLKHLSPALFCTVIVLILCLTPGQNLPKVGIVNFDKAVHSLMFAGLTLLYAQGFYRQTVSSFLKRHCLAMAFFWCTLYGGVLEILQATVAINRSGDWLDFLFDALGALAVMGLWSPAGRDRLDRFPLADLSFLPDRQNRSK